MFNLFTVLSVDIHVTAGMDILVKTDPAGPNLTGRMDLGMKTNI